MPVTLSDTQPDAEVAWLQLLREAPAWRKLELLCELNSAVQSLALSGLRNRHWHAGEAELRRRLADLLLGSDLASCVYGALPEDSHDS